MRCWEYLLWLQNITKIEVPYLKQKKKNPNISISNYEIWWKVTEEVRATVEARLKESSEYQAQLEKKLMESEKEKQELQEEKRKAVENMEQQVCIKYDLS